jgi:hypothetical protein
MHVAVCPILSTGNMRILIGLRSLMVATSASNVVPARFAIILSGSLFLAMFDIRLVIGSHSLFLCGSH